MRIQTALLTIGMFCAPLTLGGQTKPVSDRPPSAQQQRDITELRAQIIELQSKLKTLEATLKFDEWQIKQKQDAQSAITLNLSEHTYQRLDLDNGFLLVSTQDAAPYLSGYKIRLNIGNPTSATYAGFKAKISWAKSYDFNQYTQASYDEWQKGVQEKEISFTDALEAGTWTPIELIVTPATAEQLAYVTLSLSTDTIRLHQK
jgi:hypothetical protein